MLAHRNRAREALQLGNAVWAHSRSQAIPASGGCPVHRCHSSTPKLHTSARSITAARGSSSGAIHSAPRTPAACLANSATQALWLAADYGGFMEPGDADLHTDAACLARLVCVVLALPWSNPADTQNLRVSRVLVEARAAGPCRVGGARVGAQQACGAQVAQHGGAIVRQQHAVGRHAQVRDAVRVQEVQRAPH